jgi:hypothetical protein
MHDIEIRPDPEKMEAAKRPLFQHLAECAQAYAVDAVPEPR